MDDTNPRHWLTAGLALMLAACAVFGMAAFVWVGRPAPGTRLGRVSEYPPSDQPYRVQVANQFVFVVNAGDGVRVLEPRFTSSNPAWNCDVKWVPTNGRFEDPCSGAKFALTGEWIPVHGLAADELEHRGLGSYPVTERNGRWYVQLRRLTPGGLEVTATPGE